MQEGHTDFLTSDAVFMSWKSFFFYFQRTKNCVVLGRQACLTPFSLIAMAFILSISRMPKIMDKPTMDTVSSCVGRPILIAEYMLHVCFCFLTEAAGHFIIKRRKHTLVNLFN